MRRDGAHLSGRNRHPGWDLTTRAYNSLSFPGALMLPAVVFARSRPCEALGPAWQMRQQFEGPARMAHRSGDVTMGTETAVDQEWAPRPAL